jgi:putative ABC transport system permease protein
MRRLMNVGYYNSLLLQIRSWRNMDDASVQVSQSLGRRHQSLAFTGPDFQVQNQKSLLDAQLAAFNRLSFFLRWIAASTLAVSSLGIFGVAWIGVGHRSCEIGTRRAIGATRLDVFTQFFAEAITGPLIGCGAGVAASWLVLQAIDQRVQQPFLFSKQTSAEAALVSSALYAISALACCARAIRVEPSVAIRRE